MMKKRLAITFALMLSITLLFSACNSEKQAPSSDESGANESKTRTITDGIGRQVEIPNKIERIIAHGDAPRMLTYLQMADKIVGIPECCKYSDKNSPIKAYSCVNKELWKDLPIVGTNSYGAREWYPEEMIACNGDIIICTYNEELADEIQSKTGIPVVAYPNTKLFSDEYNKSLLLIGDICGKKERAEELVKYIKDTLDDLNNRTKDFPEDKKITALAAAATYCGKHSIDWIYANYPVFEALSVNDMAKGLAEKSTGFQVDKETVLNWNPEILFFDAGNMHLVREDYELNPDYFEQLKAVKNDNLYQWPNSTYHYSNIEIPLATGYFVGSILYPDEFSDIVFEDKANEIFKMFLGVDDYMKVLDEGGVGYGKANIK